MALIAYARVSTDEQTTAPPTDVLRRAGCSVIFEERASGADRERPQLRLAIELPQGRRAGCRPDRPAGPLAVSPTGGSVQRIGVQTATAIPEQVWPRLRRADRSRHP
jgi:hypothetical protein